MELPGCKTKLLSWEKDKDPKYQKSLNNNTLICSVLVPWTFFHDGVQYLSKSGCLSGSHKLHHLGFWPVPLRSSPHLDTSWALTESERTCLEGWSNFWFLILLWWYQVLIWCLFCDEGIKYTVWPSWNLSVSFVLFSFCFTTEEMEPYKVRSNLHLWSYYKWEADMRLKLKSLWF